MQRYYVVGNPLTRDELTAAVKRAADRVGNRPQVMDAEGNEVRRFGSIEVTGPHPPTKKPTWTAVVHCVNGLIHYVVEDKQ